MRQWHERADQAFIVEPDGGQESYGDFMSRSAALAHLFAGLGLAPGETIAIFAPSGLPALHAWMATVAIGCAELPIHPGLTGAPLQHILATAKPRIMLAHWSCLPALTALTPHPAPLALLIVGRPEGAALPRLAELELDYEAIVAVPLDSFPQRLVSAETIGSVLFTSGTSGPSKGALLPNGQLIMVAEQVIAAIELTDTDRFYCVHPLNHVAGKYMGVFATLLAGGTLVLERRFDAAVWLQRVRDFGITASMAHGPMIELVHAQPETANDGTHAMRRMMCCPLPRGIGTAFEQRFALKGVEMWGMTEIGNPLWTNLHGERIAGSCGRALTDWYDVTILDPDSDLEQPAGEVGEIVVRPKYSATTMSGYLGLPEATQQAWQDGWFRSGDAAYRDMAGNYFYVDRITDRIRRRSENVSSFDIEMAAADFPGVVETAAVGVASRFEADDDIKLFVASCGPLHIPALLAHLAAQLPYYMMPRYIEQIEILPRTLTQKVQKMELRARPHGPELWDREVLGPRLLDLYPKPTRA
jgi:crotonobetaine/carnitine-CoA ligase